MKKTLPKKKKKTSPESEAVLVTQVTQSFCAGALRNNCWLSNDCTHERQEQQVKTNQIITFMVRSESWVWVIHVFIIIVLMLTLLPAYAVSPHMMIPAAPKATLSPIVEMRSNCEKKKKKTSYSTLTLSHLQRKTYCWVWLELGQSVSGAKATVCEAQQQLLLVHFPRRKQSIGCQQDFELNQHPSCLLHRSERYWGVWLLPEQERTVTDDKEKL